MEPPSAVARISHEQLVLAKLRSAAESLPHVNVFSGQKLTNRFGIEGWEIRGHQTFQYGDLRFEAEGTTLVVEAESAGGVSNLVKYWPLLASHARPHRLVIVHLFQIGSDGDYIAHRHLWTFLVDQMHSDLDSRIGLRWSSDWEAHRFTYRPGEDLPE